MKIKKFLCLFLFFIIIMITFIPKVYGYSGKVAYIYNIDTTDAYSYKTLFNNNGFQTDLIFLSNITIGMLDKYDMIIMGSNTGYNDTWYGTTSQLSIINGSKLPIIGIGVGGFTFFGINGLNLTIGYGYGSYSTLPYKDIETVNKAHTIFNIPKELPKGNLRIDYTGCTVCYVFLLEIPSNIITFGRISQWSYTHLIEDGRYFLWGFINSPYTMTEIGKDLFINILNFYAPPKDSNGFFENIPGYNLFIFIGIFSVSTIIIIKKKFYN